MIHAGHKAGRPLNQTSFVMYMYFGYDEKTKATRMLGIYPSTRGRPPKNHNEEVFKDFEFYSAIVPDDEADKFDNLSDLRTAIGKGAIATYENTGILANGGMIEMGAAALVAFLEKQLSDGEMPPSAEKQIKAISPVLVTGLDTLITKPSEMVDALGSISDVLDANIRLINAALAAGPNVGWFHKAPSAAPTVSETAAKNNEDDDNDTPVESIKMATATANFGFGRLSVSDATAAPELKVRNAAEEHEDSTNNGVFMPRPDDTYIVNEQIAQLFKILQISRQNSPQNIKLVGPHGCGKTELAIQFAARLKLPLLIMDCANLREARDWFGYKSAREGTVYWHESQFVKAVAAGNHVILLDELNRANPHLLNTLMPLLDARRFTYLEEKGDKICVGPGTVFFASMNEGAGYTGTSALDRAIRDRFPRVVELTYLGEEDEIALLVRRVGVDKEIATRLVQMARKIREDASGLSASLTDSLSTRQLIAAAHDFAIGGVETLTFTIINHFSADGDDDSERVRVQNIIQGKFGDMLAAAAAAEAAKKGA